MKPGTLSQSISKPVRRSLQRSLGKQLGLLAVVTTLGLPLLPTAPTQAQTRPAQPLLEQQATLQPVQHEYTFAGKKGQAVTVSMISDDFDSFLSLQDASGETIATNDDFARAYNAAIVITLPADGNYKVLAQSFSGQGGKYTVTVKPATAYEQAYARGMKFYLDSQFTEAITAYSEAIRLSPNQPIAYLDRGDAHYAQGNLRSLVADYQKAADLYEQAGDRDNAEMVREQIQYIEEADEQHSSVFSYPEPSF